jgi:hypothetical protein
MPHTKGVAECQEIENRTPTLARFAATVVEELTCSGLGGKEIYVFGRHTNPRGVFLQTKKVDTTLRVVPTFAHFFPDTVFGTTPKAGIEVEVVVVVVVVVVVIDGGRSLPPNLKVTSPVCPIGGESAAALTQASLGRLNALNLRVPAEGEIGGPKDADPNGTSLQLRAFP